MKKIVIGFVLAFMFVGCSSNDSMVLDVPQIAVGSSMAELKLNDQFANLQSVQADTTKIVFAFSKQTGHDCNDFLATKAEDYLSSKNMLFVADISNAPALIRSMFIAPGLKDFKHTIMVLDAKDTATKLRPSGDLEKIVVVSLENYVINNVVYLDTVAELEELVGN